MSLSRSLYRRISPISLTPGALACIAGLCLSPAALGQDAVATAEGDPLDLPGREPAPRSREELKEPAAVKADAVLREWFGGQSWTQWKRATGDWGGLRTDLEAGGLTIAGSITHDWSSVFQGGVNERSSSRRLLDINATFDLEKIFGWKGGTVYADFYHYGGRIINDAGDIAGYSNIATDRHKDQLAELWFQQKLFDDLVRVKFGKIDANREFAFINPATSFLHSAAMWSPNMVGFPTYPEPAMGAVAFLYPTKFFYAGFGFFDGATAEGIRTGARAGFDTFFSSDKTDSNFLVGEAGFTWSDMGKIAKMGKGRIAGGVWHHTHEFFTFDAQVEDGTTGGYCLLEQQVIRRNPDDEASDKGLWVFARAGFADDNVAAVGTHVGVGVSIRGTFEGRDDDEFGVLWNFSDMSGKNAAFEGDENAIEVFYRLQLFGSVAITPDFQYINNPSGNNSISDAYVGTVRMQVSF